MIQNKCKKKHTPSNTTKNNSNKYSSDDSNARCFSQLEHESNVANQSQLITPHAHTHTDHVEPPPLLFPSNCTSKFNRICEISPTKEKKRSLKEKVHR